MKAKVVSLLAAGCLLVSVAWLMHEPTSAQTFDVPEKYKETVRKGLEYLVKHQCDDGHWEGDGGKHPVATTALAGIALLMEGNTLKGKYAANIQKAADWLMSQSERGRDGLIFSGHASETEHYMDGHGFATQFMAWTCQYEKDPARRKKQYEIVRRAVDCIVKARSTQGGWYRTSKVEGHDFAQVSTTAIQLQALYIASNAGIPVDRGVTMDAQQYLKMEIEKRKDSDVPAADLAAALVCRAYPYAFLDQDGLIASWRKRCRIQVPMAGDIKLGRDELTHYWYAQTLYSDMLNESLSADNSWSEYRAKMFDHLASSQAKDGSWPAPSEAGGGIRVGPIHATAVWCAVLQFDKKNHPLTHERLRATF